MKPKPTGRTASSRTRADEKAPKRPRRADGRPIKRIPKPGDQTGQKPLGYQIQEPTRLNRFIAQCGVTSRRKADELIASGIVKVNGEVVTELGTIIQPDDRVTLNNKPLTPQPYLYILLNKPMDAITTVEDEKGSRTVMDLVELPDEEKVRLYPVGRLDRDTIGALLITNDGELANRLMHPSYEIEKYYLVETEENVKPSDLEKLKKGIELEDGWATMDEVSYLNPDIRNLLGVMLHEGKNRQIRRMIEAIGHQVRALERVRYASLTCAGLRRGRWRHLTPAEVRRIKHMVRLK